MQSQNQLAIYIVKSVIRKLVDEEIRFTFINRIADSDLAVATTFLRDISLKRFGHCDSGYINVK